MTAPSTLTKLRAALKERDAWRESEYRRLVERIADGEEHDPAGLIRCFEDTLGRLDFEQFERDVIEAAARVRAAKPAEQRDPTPAVLIQFRAAVKARREWRAAEYARLVEQIASGEEHPAEALIHSLETTLGRPDLDQFDRDVMARVEAAAAAQPADPATPDATPATVPVAPQAEAEQPAG